MLPQGQGPRLLDRVRDQIRFRHYSLRTEQAYVDWVRRYVRFNANRHPSELGAADLERFLTHLAVDLDVAASTQNQAQSALLFLYREVLAIDVPWLGGIVRAKTPRHLPVVLTPDEVAELIRRLRGSHRLLAELLYGTGMRIMEGLRLRVKDVDFARNEILVRDGKGAKDRVTMLPQAVASALRRQLCRGAGHPPGPTWRTDTARCGCRRGSRASTRTPRGSGHGSTCSRPIGNRSIRAAGSRGAIT